MSQPFLKKRTAIVPALAILIFSHTNAQIATTDTGFIFRITNARWMPDGSSLLISLLKIDKARKTAPVGKIYLYYLQNKTVQPFDIPGGSPAVSADQKKLVYISRKENQETIFIYDPATKKEKPAVADSFHKFSPSWSADSRKIAYSRKMISNAREAAIEIFIYDLITGENKQLTQSNGASSWGPAWAPVGNEIAYYLEKGDSRDQIWLTDSGGSFFTNLTNDTSTHNYYPFWVDNNTIAYTQSPDATMTIEANGKNRKKISGLGGDQIRYNYKTGRAVYVQEDPANRVLIYNWKDGSSDLLFDLEGFLNMIP